MYAPVNTRQDNTLKAESRHPAVEETPSPGFADNRQEASQLRKLKKISDNSPQASHISQLQQIADSHSQGSVQKKENNTGLPDNLKSGVENLSGYSMDDVKVHYNSAQPGALQAHAYAQGTNIHIAPGQEKHLPHEAWHVAQQKQGRVQPTKQLKGMTHINDDAGLEKEADMMGAKALNVSVNESGSTKKTSFGNRTTQLVTKIEHTTGSVDVNVDGNMESHTVGVAMDATLDPKDPVVGSATGVNTKWMQAIRAQNPGANVVRGHLLNHDLGGFGIEENLFPISTKANAKHSSDVEQKVKKELNDLDKLIGGRGQDKGFVRYQVTVADQVKQYEQAKFVCSWGVQEPDKAFKAIGVNVPIPSDLKTDRGGFGGGVKSNQSPVSWQHKKERGGKEVDKINKRLGKMMKEVDGEAAKISFKGADIIPEVKEHGYEDHIELLNDLLEDHELDVIERALTEVAKEASANKDVGLLRIIIEMLDVLNGE